MGDFIQADTKSRWSKPRKFRPMRFHPRKFERKEIHSMMNPAKHKRVGNVTSVLNIEHTLM